MNENSSGLTEPKAQSSRPRCEATHSPLPWSFAAINGDNAIMSGSGGIHGKITVAEIVCDGALIYQDEADANKQFIVRACNNAERLAQALRDLTREIHLGKLNIRKDFSLMNAHASATKALNEWDGFV